MRVLAVVKNKIKGGGKKKTENKKQKGGITEFICLPFFFLHIYTFVL